MRLNRIVTPAAWCWRRASGLPGIAQPRERGGERPRRSQRTVEPGQATTWRTTAAPRAQTIATRAQWKRGTLRVEAEQRRDYAVPRYSVPPARAPYRNDYGPGRPATTISANGHVAQRLPYGRTYYAPLYRYAYPNRGYGSATTPAVLRTEGGVRFGLGVSIFAGTPFGFSFVYGRAPAYAYRYPMRQGIAYGGGELPGRSRLRRGLYRRRVRRIARSSAANRCRCPPVTTRGAVRAEL